MFDIYSKIYDLKISEIKTDDKFHLDVKFYKVYDN